MSNNNEMCYNIRTQTFSPTKYPLIFAFFRAHLVIVQFSLFFFKKFHTCIASLFVAIHILIRAKLSPFIGPCRQQISAVRSVWFNPAVCPQTPQGTGAVGPGPLPSTVRLPTSHARATASPRDCLICAVA